MWRKSTACVRAALVCALLPLVACLLPPPVDEAETVPNLPPRIEPDSLTPAPTEGVKNMTTLCPPYQFFAELTDPDPDDTLYWRVFLDYNLQQVPNLLATEIRSTMPGVTINFDVDPNDPRFQTSGTFTAVHTVELFIADRPFTNVARQPYARSVETDGLTDSFMWAIDLSNTAECIVGGQ